MWVRCLPEEHSKCGTERDGKTKQGAISLEEGRARGELEEWRAGKAVRSHTKQSLETEQES